MKKNLTKAAAFAFVAMAASFEASAQNNLGSACGCPTVSSRPTVSMSTLATIGGATDGDLTATNTILTCDKTYILDNKIYVPAGKTLTIMPGTVIKGASTGTTAAANAILVGRGGKIIADGTQSCPIVFTAQEDPMDGTYAMSNKGKWGGIILLGKAKNNLTVASNYSAAGTIGWQGTAQVGGVNTTEGGDGIGFVEGFLAADARNLYGMPPGQEDDNDNSGIIRYVSIRHAGATVGANNEINGLTCASVGRGTTLDHIEVIANDDDGIEFFGGTVNIKYAAMMFGNDDMFDYDLGWRGKAQFIFGLQLDAATITGGDNGFECDNDDQKSNSSYGSKCQIYNATIIGNASTTTATGGGSGAAAIKAKERTEGSIYSSIFANFKGGLDLIKSVGTRTGTIESYHNWTGVDNAGTTIVGGPTLFVGCNTFVNCTNPLSIANSTATVIAADQTKFAADGNASVATLAGFDFTFAGSGVIVTDKFDAVPASNITTTCTPPVDGFFTPVTYRGAFDATGTSWLSDWAYAKLISATTGLVACPTDINKDGITNTNDFLDLVGQFGQSCN